MRQMCIAFFGCLLAIVGCQSETAPVSQTTALTCAVPTLTPQAETKVLQDKGGLKISVTPVQYAAAQKTAVTIQQIAPPTNYAVLITGQDVSKVYTRKKTVSSYAVEPGELRFVLKINNEMPRVFRGQGTVVQFNVGGTFVPVEQRGYSNFLGSIIPPRQEQQIEIVGPPISSLKDKKGIIGLLLWDVVTDQDKAGTVTEKQNFEWYFSYTIEDKQLQTAVNTQDAWMPVAEFQQVQMKQQQDLAQQQMEKMRPR